jgi:hypothetical protein
MEPWVVPPPSQVKIDFSHATYAEALDRRVKTIGSLQVEKL